MRFGLKSAIVGAAAFAVLVASGGTSFALLSDFAGTPDEQKAAGKCYATIQKELAKYAATHAKLVVKCKASVIKGKGGLLGDCNPLTGDLGTKNSDAIAKLDSKIAGKCGGPDKLCDGIDDIPLSSISWDFGACRPLETNDPGGTITTCADITPCVTNNIIFANHQVLNDVGADVFNIAAFGDGGLLKGDNKCQQAAFKEINKFYQAKLKTVGKCWQAKGKLKVGSGFDDSDPCPETDPKGKTSVAILKIEQKMAKGLCGKCSVENGVALKLGDGNKDGVCDGADKITPVSVAAGDLDWFTGLTCPSVIVPPSDVLHRYDDPSIPGISYGDGNPANGADCGAIGTIDTLQEYIDCVTCVAEFKADCVLAQANGEDAGLGMEYPAECGVPACGNGVLDVGESCDASAAFPDSICPNAGNGNQVCNPDCTCDCPAMVTFEPDPNDPSSVLSTGFSGFAHGAKVIGQGTVTVALSGGDEGDPGKRDPTCGEMDITGPLQNPLAGAGQIDVLRCSASSWMTCDADSDCPAVETCATYFGSRLPLSAGGVSACVTNRFAGPIIGTANIETGASANTVNLLSEVFVGLELAEPCDLCIGDLVANDGSLDGECSSGTRSGMPCDVGGVSPVPAFNGSPMGSPNDACTGVGVPSACCSGAGTGSCLNGTSHDCPPSIANTGILPINLSNSTGTESLTTSATGPACHAFGFTLLTCMCDTCATPGAEPCNSDSDCPGMAVDSCGGPRCIVGGSAGNQCTMPGVPFDPACQAHCTGAGVPEGCCSGPGTGFCSPCSFTGEPTRPNTCTGGTCVAGECPGTTNGYCGPTETFRGCLVGTDCPFPGDSCSFLNQPCFNDNGIVGGIIDATGAADIPVNDDSSPTLASAFCVGPVAAPAINSATGLPGAATVTLTGDAEGTP